MKYKKILVIYKKPYSEAEKREDIITRKVVEPILESDKDVKIDWKYRVHLSKELISKYDLIMSFGGDGTFTEASHYIYDSTPIFGINSDYRPEDPDSSEGYLLSATKNDFPEQYEKLQKGELKEHKFNRLQAELNGKKLEHLILNEVFVAHIDPAIMSRMVVKVGDIEESQRHDGLFIVTAVNNWALLYGGEVLPLTSEKISYVSRGFLSGRLIPNPKLRKGVTDCIEVYSKMRNGKINIDGKHIEYPFGLGAKLKVYPLGKPLTVLGFDEEKRKYYIKRKD